MSARKPESVKSKSGRKNGKRLSLNKQTLKDLSGRAEGPVGGRKPGACSHQPSGCP